MSGQSHRMTGMSPGCLGARLAFAVPTLLAVSCASASDRDSHAPPDARASNEDIVVNELSTDGTTEWLELANKGPLAWDLGGYALTDSDKATGQPKASDALRFPRGTWVEPGGRILVVLHKTAVSATTGPHAKAECLPDGPETCFFATFGVSTGDAEAVHFLGPDDTLLTTTAYPAVVLPAKSDKTACRIPDLTGPFSSCSPTPGAINASP